MPDLVRRATSSNPSELKVIAEEIKRARKGDYDCIIGASGGLDSSYVIYVAKKLLGLNPLVITYDHGFFHEHARQNLLRLTQALGVELREFRSKGQYDRKYVKAIVRALSPLGVYWGVCSFCQFVLPAVRNKCAYTEGIATMLTSNNVYENNLHLPQSVKLQFMKRRVLLAGLWRLPGVMFWLTLAGYWLLRLRAEHYTPPLRNLMGSSLRAPWLKSINVTKYVPWDVDQMVETLRREVRWELPAHPNILMRFDCMIEESLINHTYKQATGCTVHGIIVNNLIHAGVRTKDQLRGAVDYYDGNMDRQMEQTVTRLGFEERKVRRLVAEVASGIRGGSAPRTGR